MGGSTPDLLDTLHRLAGWKVSLVAMGGMTFELDTPNGRMMATIPAGIAQFERELNSERAKSGLAAAKARGSKLGRQPGGRLKPDRPAPKILQLVGEGRSWRWIARDPGQPGIPSASPEGRMTVHSRSVRHRMCGQSPVKRPRGEGNMPGAAVRPLPEPTRSRGDAGRDHPSQPGHGDCVLNIWTEILY